MAPENTGSDEPVSGGWQTSREVMLTRTSGVGEADASGSYTGTEALDLAGITGHRIFVSKAPDPPGAYTSVLLERLQPDTGGGVGAHAKAPDSDDRRGLRECQWGLGLPRPLPLPLPYLSW